MKKLNETIRQLIPWTGLPQAAIANMIGTSTAQLSQYLNGNSSPNKDVLEKLLKVVGLDHGIISDRLDLIGKAARVLQQKGVSPKEVAKYSQSEMVRKTSLKEIGIFKDVDRKGLEFIVKSHVSDYTETFPYVKAMILLAMGMGASDTKMPNSKDFNKSFLEVTTKYLPLAAATGAMAGSAAGAMGVVLNAAKIINPALAAAGAVGGAVGAAIAALASGVTKGKYKQLEGTMNTSVLDIAFQLADYSHQKK